MNQVLKRKLLNIPILIWMLQLVYVAFALGLFAVLAIFTNQVHHGIFQFIYVLVMIALNISWRVTVTKKKPEWF